MGIRLPANHLHELAVRLGLANGRGAFVSGLQAARIGIPWTPAEGGHVNLPAA